MNPKEPMSRLQKDITHWLKDNVPTKKTKFLYSHVVQYFIGKRAVDLLMEDSPWAARSKTANVSADGFSFSSREECSQMLDTLLRYKMFHRARKIPVTDEKDRKGKKKDKSDSEPEKDKPEIDHSSDVDKVVAESPVAGDDELTAADASTSAAAAGEPDSDEKRRKRRIRLDMHLDQMFVDSSDAYVWLYDPVPWHYWLVGGAIVLALAGLCLFPLWPRKIRRGTHWIVWLSACFMVGVIIAALLKYTIFGLLYGLSGGKLRFWILPNLSEDVSFLRSFWPLYAYTYTGKLMPEDDADQQPPANSTEDSDSNESGKSAFEFVEKSKEE